MDKHPGTPSFQLRVKVENEPLYSMDQTPAYQLLRPHFLHDLSQNLDKHVKTGAAWDIRDLPVDIGATYLPYKTTLRQRQQGEKFSKGSYIEGKNYFEKFPNRNESWCFSQSNKERHPLQFHSLLT